MAEKIEYLVDNVVLDQEEDITRVFSYALRNSEFHVNVLLAEKLTNNMQNKGE